MFELSIVIGFRDRDLERVINCLESLNNQSIKDFELLFVDYGSKRECAKAVEQVCNNYSFCQYIFVDVEGQFWNRAHCLNIGVKKSKAYYVLTSDIDIIFDPDFVATLLADCSKDSVVHAPVYYLDAGVIDIPQDVEKLESAVSYGICSCVHRDVFYDVGGYDEFYCIWGAEDRDLKNKLEKQGIKEKILSEKALLFHQWHPATDLSEKYIPHNFWAEIYNRLLFEPSAQKNIKWGSLDNVSQNRLILQYIDSLKGVDKSNSELSFSFINLDYPRRESIKMVFNAFEMLMPGEVLAVNKMNFPRPNKYVDFLITLLNKRIPSKWNTSIHYNSNPLREALFFLILHQRSQIQDYYWNAEILDGVTFIQKK